MVSPFFYSFYSLFHHLMIVSVQWLLAKLTKFGITNEIGVYEVIYPEIHRGGHPETTGSRGKQ